MRDRDIHYTGTQAYEQAMRRAEKEAERRLRQCKVNGTNKEFICRNYENLSKEGQQALKNYLQYLSKEKGKNEN